MTSKMLLEQYMAERRALGFSLKTDEGCIRRFLQDFVDPDDGDISFTKEYVLSHIGNRRNMQTNTILRDVSAINGFLDFVVRKGYEEFFITAFDGDVMGLYDYLTEYENLDELNHLAHLISELDSDEIETLEAALNNIPYVFIGWVFLKLGMVISKTQTIPAFG